MPYNKTQREVAQAVGIHESRLSRLRNQGTIKKSVRKVPGKNSYRYDVEKLQAELEQNLAPENRERRGKKPGEKADGSTPEEKEKAIKKSKIAEEATGMSYSKARELNEAYKAALKKLEYEERSGKLVDVEVATGVMEKILSLIINHLEAFPNRCASLVAVEPKEFDCRKILQKEISYARQEMIDSIKQLDVKIKNAGKN